MEMQISEEDPHILILPIADTIAYIEYNAIDQKFKISTHNSVKIFTRGQTYFFISNHLLAFCGNLHVNLDEVYILNIDDKTMIQKAPMPTSLCCLGAHKLNDRIYIFGGSIGSFSWSDKCSYFDLTLDCSTPISNLPKAAHNITSYKKNDYIVLAGYAHTSIYRYYPAIDRFSVELLYNKFNSHKILLMHRNAEYIISFNEVLIREENQEQWSKYQSNFGGDHLVSPLVRHEDFFYFAEQFGSIRRFNTINNQIETMELIINSFS